LYVKLKLEELRGHQVLYFRCFLGSQELLKLDEIVEFWMDFNLGTSSLSCVAVVKAGLGGLYKHIFLHGQKGAMERPHPIFPNIFDAFPQNF